MKYYTQCERKSAVMHANNTNYTSMHGVILAMFAFDALLTVNVNVVPECYFHLRIPFNLCCFFNTGSAFLITIKKLIMSTWGT